MGTLNTLSLKKLVTAISHIENKCYEYDDGEMNAKHFSNVLEIFKLAGKKTKIIKLLPNSQGAIPLTSIVRAC